MKIKRTAAALLLSAVFMAQAAMSALAVPEDAGDPRGQTSQAFMSAALPMITAENVCNAIETSFVENDPDLRELSQYVFEGDTLPCSQNDPSYHKHIEKLMLQRQSSGGSLTSLAGAGLLTRAITTGKQLIHQDRFADHTKTFGVDVSYYQGAVDWEKLKAEGVTYAIIRVGYRGYGWAGTLVQDTRFKEYIEGASKAGLEIGVYFFTQAITTKEAEQEADFVYERIKNYKLDLPVYFDMEDITYDTGRLDSANLSAAKKTAIVEAFCNRIQSKGYKAGLYSNASWLLHKLDGERLQSLYPLWFANYTSKTTYTFNFDIWQYGTEKLNGINGGSGVVDMNVRYQLPSVTGLKIENNTEETVRVSWNEISGVTGYELLRQDADGVSVIADTEKNYAEIPLESADLELSVRAYRTLGKEKCYGDLSEAVKPDDSLFIERIMGDVSGDGEFDRIDANMLARYCAHWDGYDKKIIQSAADVNGDGVIDRLDANILARCAANWVGYREKYLHTFTDYSSLKPAEPKDEK